MHIEKNISKFFGLDGEKWLKHANPFSVWTRFIILPFFVLAIWSRTWIGYYTLIPILLLIVWTFINPLLFKKTKHTTSWASKAVLGEKILSNRDKVSIPKHHLKAKNILTSIQLLGTVILIYGLFKLTFWPTMLGLSLVYLGKMWFLDRMVWLFEDMKNHDDYKNLLF